VVTRKMGMWLEMRVYHRYGTRRTIHTGAARTKTVGANARGTGNVGSEQGRKGLNESGINGESNRPVP
jgi:hypothetical protein